MHHKQCDIEFKFHEDKQIYLRNKYCFAAIWFPEKVAEFKSFLSICVTLGGFRFFGIWQVVSSLLEKGKC